MQLRDVDSSASSLVRVGDCWSLYCTLSQQHNRILVLNISLRRYCSQLLHIRNIFLVLDRRLHTDMSQAYNPPSPNNSTEF